MLLEVDSTTLPHPRTPHLMCEARCPFCGRLTKLVSYFDLVELPRVLWGHLAPRWRSGDTIGGMSGQTSWPRNRRGCVRRVRVTGLPSAAAPGFVGQHEALNPRRVP
jgi:hypothetical protein